MRARPRARPRARRRSVLARIAVAAIASSSACAAEPELEIVAVRELGPLTPPAGVETWTRGYSVFGFGRAVWLFGDTRLTEPDADGSSIHGNSWATTLDLAGEDGVSGLQLATGLDGGPAELLTRTAEELAFDQANAGLGARTILSPMAAVRDDANDRVLLFYAKLEAGSGGASTPIGSSVAVWTELELGPIRPILDASSDEPTLLFRAPEPALGQAALIDDGQVYAYACRDELYRPCVLARVELDAVFEREAWAYWTGHGWSPTSADAVALVEADTVLSVSYNPEVSRYLMVHADPRGAELQLRYAPAPEGPWSTPLTVLAPEHDEPIVEVLAHPEYRRGGGQLELLSYRAGEQLRLVEIELAARR